MLTLNFDKGKNGDILITRQASTTPWFIFRDDQFFQKSLREEFDFDSEQIIHTTILTPVSFIEMIKTFKDS